MSRKGNCCDNAFAESFFTILKKELIYFLEYKSNEEAKKSIFEYIEVWDNRSRIHSSIGYIISASLAVEIGDWKRFNNEKQVAAFFGLTPAEYSSGESRHRGRITGQGNPILRMYLVQASWYLIDKDEKMKIFFKRIYTQSGSKKKVIVAVARKLICRIFSIVKNERKYEVCAAA